MSPKSNAASRSRSVPLSVVLGFLLCLALGTGAFALEAINPIMVGFTAPISGTAAASGNQLITALQLWRDDVNSKGGLLGRPVALVYYDDENSPARVPPLYRKLIVEDKVDALIGPYGTNMAASAMRILLEFNKVTVSVLGIGVNRVFSNPKHFSMSPTGEAEVKAFARSMFELAKSQAPTPKTVAIVASNSDFENSCAESARTIANEGGFEIVEDRRYPKNTSDFTSLKELQTANADVVFLAATAGASEELLRKINELHLAAEIIGGVVPGLSDVGLKAKLGPLLNGLVAVDNFPPGLAGRFAGATELLKRYRGMAGSSAIDSSGDIVPYAYAAGQVLSQAIDGAKTIDSDHVADYIHSHKFDTVVGPLKFDADGEWTEARVPIVQFQGVVPNNSIQFSQNVVQPIVWPPLFKTGKLIYPYSPLKK